VGDKEAAAEAVSVRTRGKGDEGSVGLTEFIARAQGLLASKAVAL
jgi:threonyl-tRNA synthetase